jgi:hypothetical protein
MSIVIDLTAATICFVSGCFPALVGKDTPTGEFTLQQRYTLQAGYGGDVLQFHETPSHVFAIHRPWLLRPEQKRQERLDGKISSRLITSGCVNVSKEVYEALVDCCQGQTITIRR